MKRWTRKLLAGLLSFGMLLQVASPLSALAADSGTQGGKLSILCASELLATMNREADGTLSWENGYNPFEDVQIAYDAASRTYKFEGMLTPPKNGYMTMKTDSAEDSIYIDGGDQKAVNGTVYIGTEESPIKNVTITSSNSEATVKEQAIIRATGDVELFNTGGGQVAEQAASDYKARSVSIVGGSSTVPTAGVFIWVEDASGDVTIANNEEDGLIAGGRVRVKADGNVDIKGGIAKTSRDSTKSDVISGGKVTFDANASSANALKDMSLTVTADDAVTLKSHSSNSFLSGEKAYIDVTAPSLTVGNNGSGVIDGTVKFTRTNTTDAYRVAVGESESNNTQTALTGTTYSETVNAKYLNIQPGTPENTTVKHTLTLTNAKAYTDENHTVEADKNEAGIYSVAKGTKVYVVAEAPDNVSRWKFTGWEESSETSENITVTVNENTTLTAKWEKVTDQVTNYGITVKIGSGDPIKVTSENCGNILGDDYTDDYTDGKLTYNPDTHTLTGEGSFGGMKVEITDDFEDKVDVVLSNANGAVVNGSLTVTGAQDVKVTGVSSTALIMEDATITCAGDILMDNTGVGNVLGYTRGYHGNLDVKSAQNVTIHGVGRTGTDEDENNYTIYGKAEIDCSGDVEITSQNGGAVWDPVVITNAADVTITAAQRAVWDSRPSLDSSIHCSGKVKITSETAAALYEGDLKITGATDVTISGKRDDGATIGGAAEITCSGDVVLENKGTGAVVESKLVYKQNPAKGYEVKTGENAESATVAYTDEEGTTSYTVPNTETDTETNPVPSYISIAAVSTPTDVPGDDDFTGGDSGAGGAVAAVVVGGAAAFVGYEIATDIILRDLLPAGADIPVNRGQLAWLIWGAKGAPEPENQPAFTDVSEPEMAKAAQWCVEQGILTAPGETTFRPNGWVTRVKVIQTWNTAFPKQ